MTALRNELTPEELAARADEGQPEKARWSQLEQLVAVVADRVAELAFVYVSANTEKGKRRPPRPTPISRPGAQQARPKQAMSDEQALFLFDLLKERT